MNHRLPPVLAIEDSLDDIEFMRRAFSRLAVKHPLVVAENGDEALSLLRGEWPHQFGEGPLWPALILLDLNLPGLGGRELLKRLKADETLRPLPVVIFTTSAHAREIDACYRLGAAAFHSKSSDVREYEETIRSIANYWLSRVKLPPRDEAPLAMPLAGAWTLEERAQ